MRQIYIRPEIEINNLDVESETCLTVSASEDYLNAGESFINQKGDGMTDCDWEAEEWEYNAFIVDFTPKEAQYSPRNLSIY